MPQGELLLSSFASSLPPDVAARTVFDDKLGSTLKAMAATGRTAWPTVDVEARVFVQHLAALPWPLPPEPKSLIALHVSDLYLACACVQRCAGAAEAFASAYALVVENAVCRQLRSTSEQGDVRQRVMEKLLVGTNGGAPRLVQYQGRGALKSWLKAVALREAISLLRKSPREVPVPDDELFERATRETSPELEALRNRYRPAFREAFLAAVRALPAKERAMLKQHYVDGLNIDRLGELHGVHRATAARWLEKTRARLFSETHAALRGQLPVETAEFQSVARLIHSQMNISLRQLLGAASPDDKAV
jgi:RNA polymerase sigma-70 factor (ECF subfamily)